ncbi:branched-subunit amino acid transport protein [Rhodovulum iodosum]|uniref:Branched-subunit amino acid transport protein n=1 Tax=Rhodovulum iodosum TaxID=68291 RepID=A0ABV3XRC9_9RHOB|nr:AzlD domain-containing protein [Rhodovulum robiginosum]RSK32717.1 AzlD domain-containing protein [Rhodovulum robiginosum]
MTQGHAEIWLIILVLGLGTFLIRFSFLGLVGRRPLPAWALRYLRYTPVAVLPGLIAPQVIWPPATGGAPDPARMAAALVTLGVGWVTKNVIFAIGSGAATLYAGLWLLG